MSEGESCGEGWRKRGLVKQRSARFWRRRPVKKKKVIKWREGVGEFVLSSEPKLRGVKWEIMAQLVDIHSKKWRVGF